MKKFKKISDFSEVALDPARILGGYQNYGGGGGGGKICTTQVRTMGCSGHQGRDSCWDTVQDPCKN